MKADARGAQRPGGGGNGAAGLSRPPFGKSLLFKQALFVSAVVILTAAALSWAVYSLARGIIHSHVEDRLSLLVADRKESLEDYVVHQHERIGMVTGRTRLGQILADRAEKTISEEMFREQARHILLDSRRSATTFLELWLVDPDGKVIASTEEEPMERPGVAASTGVTAGRVAVSVGTVRIGHDLSGDRDFRRGKIDKHLGFPFLSEEGLRAELAAPVLQPDGTVSGVVLVLLDARPLERLISSTTGLGETGQVLVGRKLDGEVRLLLPPRGLSRTTVSAEEVPALVAATQGDAGPAVTQSLGAEVLAKYQPVKYEPLRDRNWGIVATMNVDEAYAPVTRLRRFLMALIGGLLIVGVSVAALLAWRFTRPIYRLGNMASAVAAGNFEARAPVRRADEIGWLASAFNNMAGQLARSYAGLEQRVRERTADLVETNERLKSEVAERKRAEHALRDSEALYSSLVQNVPLFVIRKDLEGQFTFVNRGFCELVKRPLDAVIGRTDYDFFPTELAEKYRRDDRRVVETGALFRTVEENRRDGEAHTFEVLKTPVRDAEDNIIGTQALFWDVTDRVRAEEALRESAARKRAVFEAAMDCMIVTDRTGRVVEFNRAAEKTFACTSGEVTGRDLGELFPQESRDRLQRNLEQYEATGESSSVVGRRLELPALRKSGERFLAEMAIQPVPLDGAPVFTIFLRDITERKRAQGALEQSERRTRMIVDTALDGFVAMDAAGRITGWNKQAEAIFGWSREDALGRTVAETIVPERFRDRHWRGLKRFLDTAEGPVLNRRIELVGLHHDGHEFPVELTISPMRLQDGTWSFNAFVHDITERKKAEAALRDAKESAEAANRAKSVFLANMSHEIRTPLNAIIGMTELVLDTDLSAAQRDYLTTVMESGESLLGVINDILDFSKIEAGKLDLDRTVFGIRESLGDTMKSLAVRAHRKDLELACHIAPDVPDALVGDPGRLRQVVVNLVGNAVKFTDRGEVVVDVERQTLADGDVVLHCSVRDTGIGIPDERLDAIFYAFEQADQSMSRRFGGTGLGLAISTRLVELMGGRIWVESEVGRGSTFHFTVRFELAKAAAARRFPAEPARLRGLRVLVVDDNATNRAILDEILDNWGMAPTVVPGAREALAAMRTAQDQGRPFALVLTDVHMPEIDGFMLAEQIQADPEFAGTIIMMLTSGDRPADLGTAGRPRPAAYLLKPVKQSELFNAIVQALGALEVEEEEEPAKTAITVPEPLAPRELPPLRILLAEDSPANQKLAVGLLTRWGHAVTVVNNGRQALAALEAGDYDLVLMDVQMPEMDGLEATRAIRQSERETGRHIPVVAMTAHAMKGDREQCLESGMDGYIAKPIRARQLRDAIAAALKETEAGGPGSEPGRVGPDRDDTPQLESASVDWPGTFETVGGDRELLKDVIRAFLDECPRLTSELQQAIHAGDTPTVRRTAHTLKGSLQTFGATAASELAARIEEMGRSGDLNGAGESLETLREQLQGVSEDLAAFDGTT